MSVDWAGYQTASGKAEGVGSQLLGLNSANHEVAMIASHDLWFGLCHQYAFVSSAALPSYPFLIEIFDHACEELKVEILDMLLGFAICSMPDVPVTAANDLKWRSALHAALVDDIAIYKELASSENEEIADFSEHIVACLLSDKSEQVESRSDIFREIKNKRRRSFVERLLRI
ncbi:hypothetical protein IWQ49_000688 [Labrenzia sp. EL_126]|nr:hypothetical protein [Labrenzia sp. EL_126]